MNVYRAGIDIGSTTIKLVVLDDNNNIIFGKYRRHCAQIQPAMQELLAEAKAELGDFRLRLKITGSGSINLGKALNIAFVQEVAAVASALEYLAPQTDVAIELGGEDAKIIYFTGGLEERMNGVCAGGTGSFIDQMAALLQTDAAGLNEEARNYKRIYPIAARCGVFAKTDIQPLKRGRGKIRPCGFDFPSCSQPDHFGTCLRKANPRVRGVSGRTSALPAGAEKGVYPHPFAHAGQGCRS